MHTFGYFFLIPRLHSISFTRAQGIPKYKIGFGREKDGIYQRTTTADDNCGNGHSTNLGASRTASPPQSQVGSSERPDPTTPGE